MERVLRAWSSPTVRAGTLCLLVAAVYAPSLHGGFLNYDDGWLIVENPVLDYDLPQAGTTILLDFSKETRLLLGAEYLPLRDLSMWLEVALFGRSPQALRTCQLLLYLLAVLGFRAAFVQLFGPARGELTAWFFALHPVHLESVAWLAGHKDVLALVFLGLALWRHVRAGRDAPLSVPLLWLAACLSKAMSVGFLGPLYACDLWLRRRPDLRLYGLSAFLLGGALLAHAVVGQRVGMVGGPLAGDPQRAWISMGEVWLRYLTLVVDASGLSIRHDAPALEHWTPEAALGWMMLVGSGMIAAYGLRRERDAARPWTDNPREPLPWGRLGLVAWLWFALPLAPVSQVWIPLQNVMADRYLWLSVAGPLLLAAHLDAVARPAWARPLLWSFCLLLAGSTAARAPSFADSTSLFAEATAKTQRDPVAPYQWGMALEDDGDQAAAMDAFRVSLARCDEADATLPKASNNLARLLAAEGRLPEAEAVLQQGLRAQPEQAKMRRNLEKVRREMREQLRERR